MKIGFGNQCLLALILGLLFGRYAPQNLVDAVVPLGTAFLKLLKMIIVPLTFSTIVASFGKLENMALLRRLGLSTLTWFFITAIIAGIIGVLVGLVVAPGAGLSIGSLDIADYVPRELPSISGVLLDMLPGNLIQDISNGKVIPVILFAIFFGIALTALHENGTQLKIFFNEFSLVMFKITRVVIRLSPIGIFALIAQVGNHYGLDTLLPLGKFIVAIYVACFFQLIVYMLLIFFVAKRNPLVFIKQFWPAMINAFTTSSSLGTLPVTLETLVDNVKINKQVAGFVAPLGATMKMDGCGAIYPSIVCILTAHIFHIDLSVQQYIMIILTSAIATLGTAGVPGTASIMATVVLVSVGLPLEGLALVIGIDKIVDMMRTLTNVTGAGVCSVIVNRRYKEE
jgi:Na+/H+-dicarboxylate symporter